VHTNAMLAINFLEKDMILALAVKVCKSTPHYFCIE
jgi:hypothetical protein